MIVISFGIDLVQPPLQFDAVGAAHLDIEQRDIALVLRHTRQRFIGIFGDAHLVALFAKPLAERIADAEFVVHDQQLAFVFHCPHLDAALAVVAGAEADARCASTGIKL